MSKRKNIEDSGFDQKLTPSSKKQKLNETPSLDEVNSNQVQDVNAALISAARDGNENVVGKLLLENGVDPNSVDQDGFTALMLAAKNGHKEVAELLLKNGANPNHAAENGCTALIYSVQNSHKDVVRLLLENGALPNQVVKYEDQEETTALLTSVGYDGDDEIAKVLLEYGADSNQILIGEERDSVTPLLESVSRGSDEGAKILLEHGADPCFSRSGEFIILTQADNRDPQSERGNEIFRHGMQVANFFNDWNDSDLKTENSIDSDFFMSVYKSQMLREGFDGRSFNDRKAQYIEIINDDPLIPKDVLGKIEGLFAEIKDNFMLKCSDLFYKIRGETISPVPLSELISQSQEGSFVPECNEYTKNLIKFYTDRGIKFSIDMENLLLNKIQADDEAIEALKEEIYVANINILQNNIGEFILGGNEVYVAIRDLITTTILPSSLRDSLGKAVICLLYTSPSPRDA